MLGPRKDDWLHDLLTEVVGSHRAEKLASQARDPLPTPRGRARAYLRQNLRATGLLYRTPAASGPSPRSAEAEAILFRSVVRAFAELALDLAVLCEAPPGPRREELLMLFAALCGELVEVEEIQARLPLLAERPLSTWRWQRIEETLERRAAALAGDPLYGLVLHNGALHIDAHVFGRQAIAYFSRGPLLAETEQWRLEHAGAQKAVLVRVLTALTSADHRPAFPARRAILRQVEDLQLPLSIESRLREEVKRSFVRPPAIVEMVRQVRLPHFRRLLLEQTLLAALVDGRRSKAEVAFLEGLASALGFSPDKLAEVELEMAEFYAKNRALVDLLTAKEGAGLRAEQLVDSVQTAMEKNFHALLQEVKETGELSLLLTKAARGHKLTADERAKMRRQLFDVAKAIPALAIFAAPGGLLLLLALAKVLPFNLLPSAFQGKAKSPNPEGPTQALSLLEDPPRRRRR